jgi:hypothetical protein
LKNAFGHARRFLFGKGKRPAGARVVRVAGDDMGMQMRERVPEQVVVELDRTQHVFEGASGD